MKVPWGLIANLSGLRIRILTSKYSCGGLTIPKVQKRANCSHTWNAITNVWKDLNCRIQWSINNGKSAQFWSDPWLPFGVVLKDIIHGSIPSSVLEALVRNYADGHVGWNIEAVRPLLPECIVDQIMGLNCLWKSLVMTL